MVEESLVCDEINGEQRREIAISILEGRKKLIGVNELQLVDDNELVRPLSLLIKRKEDKLKFLELKEDMESFPEKYFDTWVMADAGHLYITNVNIDSVNTIFARNKLGYRQGDEIRARMEIADEYDDSPLSGGNYLLRNARLAFDILGRKQNFNDEVVKKCTDYFRERLNNWHAQGITHETMNDWQRAILSRNRKADPTMTLDFGDGPAAKTYNIPFKAYDPFEDELPEVSTDEIDVGDFDDTNFWAEYAEEQKQKGEKDWYTYEANPDPAGKYYDDIGWISPSGNFYSCGYGHHQTKAYAIARGDEKLSAAYAVFYKEQLEASEKHRDRYEIANDFLNQIGWAKLRYDAIGASASPVILHGKTFTDKQLERASDVGRHFDYPYDPSAHADYHWGNG